jgi:hypothetical protein
MEELDYQRKVLREFVCEDFYQSVWMQKLREVLEFRCYSLHAIQELLTDKEEVFGETQ